MTDTKTRKTIKDTVTQTLQKLEITAEVKLEDKDDTVWVTIETDEPGILIGHHGRNLEALQTLISQMIFKKLQTWAHLILTVGDYRLKREEQIKELARNTAEKVVTTQTPHVLNHLTAAERRIVHIELAEHSQVMTASEGEGKDRMLIVKPKT